MLRKFTFFPAIILLALAQLAVMQTAQAQGNQGDNFVFRLNTGAVSADLKKEVDCGFGYAQFGASITEELCGDIVWAYGVAGDSLGCDSITQDLTGKIALIRRGVCEFSAKALSAQKSGALAVIIVNHYSNPAHTDCFVEGMGSGASGAQVTIPAIMISRKTGEDIQAAFDAGQAVSGCFLLPRMYDGAGPFHYATPVTQVTSLENMGVNYVNRSTDVQLDVILKAEITEPGGNVTTITTTLDTVAAGAESFEFFPAYLPPSVVGEFNVLYTNNKYTEPRDSLRYKFVQTDYTFATDNLVNDPGGVGTTNANFVSGDFTHQEGGLCITGPNGGIATYVTFGVSNIDSVFVEGLPVGATANDISVFLYDGDTDEDGESDLSGSFDDIPQIGYGVYTMTGNEVDGVLVDAEITDFLSGGPIELKPDHIYYVSLYYNGLEAGYGRDIRFANSKEEWSYLNFPTTTLAIGNGTALTFFNGGWNGADVVNRLQLQGYEPGVVSVKPTPLADSKVSVNPNPATDALRVNLKLAEVSDVVTLTIFDWQGRAVSTQTVRNMQEGQMNMNVVSLPSGMYLLSVRTAEGSTMRKVSVCH